MSEKIGNLSSKIQHTRRGQIKMLKSNGSIPEIKKNKTLHELNRRINIRGLN